MTLATVQEKSNLILSLIRSDKAIGAFTAVTIMATADVIGELLVSPDTSDRRDNQTLDSYCKDLGMIQ
jgi:hypothetical protein